MLFHPIIRITIPPIIITEVLATIRAIRADLLTTLH